MTTFKHSSEMKKLPEFLYHGTDCKNVESICEHGIRPGNYETCNPYSRADTTGASHVDDCLGNVSMAVKESDAIFFIVANRGMEGWNKPQCIFKIRTSKLPKEKLFFRDLSGTKLGEAKLMDRNGVPPLAIEGYKVREFHEKGKATETFHKCRVR